MVISVLNFFMVAFLVFGRVVGILSYWKFINTVEIFLCIANILMIQSLLKKKSEISSKIVSYRIIFIGFIVLILIGYAINSEFFWWPLDIIRFVTYTLFGILVFRNKK